MLSKNMLMYEQRTENILFALLRVFAIVVFISIISKSSNSYRFTWGGKLWE